MVSPSLRTHLCSLAKNNNKDSMGSSTQKYEQAGIDVDTTQKASSIPIICRREYQLNCTHKKRACVNRAETATNASARIRLTNCCYSSDAFFAYEDRERRVSVCFYCKWWWCLLLTLSRQWNAIAAMFLNYQITKPSYGNAVWEMFQETCYIIFCSPKHWAPICFRVRHKL